MGGGAGQGYYCSFCFFFLNFLKGLVFRGFGLEFRGLRGG